METISLKLLLLAKSPLSPSALNQICLLLGILIIAILAGISYLVYLYRQNHHTKHYFFSLQFPLVSSDLLLEHIHQMESMFASLHHLCMSNTDKVFFEVFKVGEYVSLLVGSNNQELLDQLQGSLSQLENTKLKIMEEDQVQKITPLFTKRLSMSKTFQPIAKNPQFFDGLLHQLSSLKELDQLGVQIILRGVNKKLQIKTQMNQISTRANKQKRSLNQREESLIKDLEEKLTDNLFKAKINLVGNNQNVVSNLLSLFHGLNNKDNAVISSRESEAKIKGRFIAPETLFSALPFIRESQGMYLTSKELAYLIHPSTAVRGKYAPKQTRDFEAPPSFIKKEEGNILIGTVETTGGEQKVYFPLNNFARHIQIFGKTGRGKSTLITSLLSDLASKQTGNGLVFDPHGDLLQDIIAVSTTSNTQKRLVYLNIKDKTKVFTINPLFAFQKSAYEKSALRDALLDIIQNETEELLGNSQSGVATYNRLKQVIDIGLEFSDAYYSYLLKQGVDRKRAEERVNERQLTLNDLPYLLEREFEYAPLLKTIFKDNTSQVGIYINKLIEKHMNQGMVVEAVQARLEQLLHSSVRLICEGSSLNISQILKGNKLFLIPIPEAVYGSRGARALMQLLFSLIWIDKRQVSQESDRVETYLFVDEFQKAQINSIPEIIAEGRKYKMYLILSNQLVGQLKENIKNAILGNIGTLIAFTLAADDIGAKLLAPFFGEQVKEPDLSNLPPFNAYLRTEGDKQKPLVTFSFQTIPIKSTSKDPDFIGQLNNKSLDQYGEDINTIEERLQQKHSNPLKYFLEGI